MRNLPDIGKCFRSAANQRRQAPARNESAQYHHEGDHKRGNGNRDQLCGCFRSRQPQRRCKAAENSKLVKLSLPKVIGRRLAGYFGHGFWGGAFHRTKHSSSSPRSRTTNGTQNCTSPHMPVHQGRGCCGTSVFSELITVTALLRRFVCVRLYVARWILSHSLSFRRLLNRSFEFYNSTHS